VRFAFKTSPQDTTWDAMLEVWRAADGIGVFESGWTSDHFYPMHGAAPATPRLEGWTTLAALAQATRRLRLGTLVTGIHYRHPAVLANMAATLDIVSGGRLELGIGTGWNEQESGAYGIETRAARGAQRPVRRGLRGAHRIALAAADHHVPGPVLPADRRTVRP
jgi:alkanesulfonate monooxygenase SsuD/methylene tetrahydromethanopterin reductase-like flavin-dependent oxidoreductase (luciferase family)